MSGAGSGTFPDSIRFACKGCGASLTLPFASPVVSGPCPKCAAWIDAREYIVANRHAQTQGGHVPEPGFRRKRRSQNVIGGRGRVRADGFLDHEYNERRELFGTLRVLAVSLAVLALILFVIFHMRKG